MWDRPYEGLKVLDISQGLAGPYCGGLLAAYGADVVKVEPLEGDWMRGIGRAHGHSTPFVMVANQGKRSLALDLKKPEAQGIALELAAQSDIVIESFRPGVADRLGLGYTAVSAVSPKVLYVSVSGFGQTGPYVGRPATDLVMQAFSGFMSINKGMDGIPHRIGTFVIDSVAGLYAFQAIATTLYAWRTRGESRHLDISLMQAVAALLAPKIAEFHLEHGIPQIMNSPTGPYPSKDGWFVVAVIKEAMFARLCAAVDAPELLEDPRFADFARRAENNDALRAHLEKIFETRTTAEWLERLHAHDLLTDRICDFGDWLADPQVVHADAAPMVEQPGAGPVPIPRLPGMPASARPDLPAPDIGEHGLEILRRLGYDPAAIRTLTAAGAVSLPKR